jgi:hypothetical protein
MLKDKIKDTIEFLCDMSPGTVWTEYHWRLVLQLKQDIESNRASYLDALLHAVRLC